MDSDDSTTRRCNLATLRRATLLGMVLLLMLLSSITVAWLLTTPSGARVAFDLVRQLSAGAINAKAINGRLIGPLQIGELTVQSANSSLQLNTVHMDWHPVALREGLLHITLLRVASLRLKLPAATDAPPTLPTTLRLPMRLQIDRLTIANAVLQQPLQKSRHFDATSLGMQFDGQRYRVVLAGLTLTTSNPVSGLVRGQMTLAATAPYAVDARLQMPNAIWYIGEASQERLQAAGTLSISGDLSAIQLALSARTFSLPAPVDLTASATLNRDRLLVSTAMLKQSHGHAKFSGAIDFSGEHDFFLHAVLHQLQLDAIIGQKGWPSMLISGNLDAKGKLGSQSKPALALQFSMHESLIGGHHLSSRGQLALTPDSLTISHLVVRAGVNTLSARGRLREHSGALGFSVHAPKLAQLGPQFSGALAVDGSATGSFARVLLALRWKVSKLRLPAACMVGISQGSAQLTLAPQQSAVIEAIDLRLSADAVQLGGRTAGSLQLHMTIHAESDAPLQIKLTAQRLLINKFHADSLGVTLSGTRAQHIAKAALVSGKETLRLDAAGGLIEADTANPVWRGALTHAETRGALRITMQGQAGLTITLRSVQLDALTLQSALGTVVVEQFRRDAQGVASRGRVDQLNVGQMVLFLEQYQWQDMSKHQTIHNSDLRLDGDWDLQIFPSAIYPLQGTLRLHRRTGDIVLRAPQPLALGLQKLDLRASAAQGQLTISFEAQGQQLGRLQMEGRATHTRTSWLPDRDSPISGVLTLQVPSIAWAAALFSEKLVTDGSLESTLRFAGTPAKPTITGRVTGRQLRFMTIDSGIDLHDGVFQGVFADDTLTVQQCQFAGRNGTLSITGPVRFNAAHAEARLRWKARQFSVSDRIDSTLIVSGDGQLIGRDGRLKAEGSLLVDRGQIDIDRTAAPHLSDDVIVAGRQRTNPPPPLLDLDMTLGLGEQLRLRGRGINASLSGAVRARSEAGGALSVVGLMQVTRGTYQAFGRELTIERGMVRFDGAPTNPALDIRAMRRGTTVEVGVAVGGNALAPRVTLVSEPSVPDAEKLSWLVLGQGLSTVSGNDASVLQSAAASLLSQSRAAGVQAQIASALGVDTVSLSKGQGTLQQNIVTLGKRLSSKLYVSYQQGLQTAGAAVLLRYTLSPRLAIEAEAGARSVLSLFYNISFD